FEQVDGGSLSTVFPSDHHTIPGDVIRAIALQINQGLAFIHKSNVFHRDIKPDNILVTASGVCKLADFGLSKQVDGSRSQTHTLIGTTVYLSPEAIQTQRYSKSSDIWAMGCTFQWLLTGQNPYREFRLPLFGMFKHVRDHLTRSEYG
ncbi:kinase-like domain-containing protein, partial [Favolaschia claudopus]